MIITFLWILLYILAIPFVLFFFMIAILALHGMVSGGGFGR